MIVVNVAGYPFAVNYNGVVITIPFDNKSYPVPDDLGTFRELKILVPPKPQLLQQDNVINVDEKVLDEAKDNHKIKKKPLKGIKIKKKKRNKILNDKKIERELKKKMKDKKCLI